MRDIKNLKPNANSRYKQGYYTSTTGKYFGPLPIIYRSSLELRFIESLERNKDVAKWSSECLQIPYTMQKNGKTENKMYNIDFVVILNNGDRFVVEVKPSTLSPLHESTSGLKIRNEIQYKNMCKWNAAVAWCKQHNYKFKIVTEKFFTI